MGTPPPPLRPKGSKLIGTNGTDVVLHGINWCAATALQSVAGNMITHQVYSCISISICQMQSGFAVNVTIARE